MAERTDETTKGLVFAAAQSHPLGGLGWGILPLVVWAILALSLLRAFTVAAPLASVSPKAAKLSASGPPRAELLIAPDEDGVVPEE